MTLEASPSGEDIARRASGILMTTYPFFTLGNASTPLNIYRIYRDPKIYISGTNYIERGEFNGLRLPFSKKLKALLSATPRAVLEFQDSLIELLDNYPPTEILITDAHGAFLFGEGKKAASRGYDYSPGWVKHLQEVFDEIRDGRKLKQKKS